VFIVDALALYAALYLAYVLRNGEAPSPESWRSHATYFSAVNFLWLVLFYLFKFYALDRPFGSFSFAARLALASGLNGLTASLVFYLADDSPISPKTLLFIYVLVSYAIILCWRIAYDAIMRLSKIRTAVGIVGLGQESLELIAALKDRRQLGYDVAFVYDEGRVFKLPAVKVLVRPDELRGRLSIGDVKLVVLADHLALSVETRRALFDQLERGIRYERLQNFYEMYLRRVPLGVISEAWFLEHIDLSSKKPYLALKRVFDIIFSSLGLILMAPFFPLVALAIRIESKGPIFFRQVRLGKHERSFTIYKFRTMRTEGNDFAPTGIKDSRITKLGNFLRKTRLDELPQMLNIVKGDMSFIGPRPERPELAEGLEKVIPFYRQRHIVKPGVTGWDQVSGEYHSPSVEDTYKKLQYDLYYVKNLSVFLDVSIIFKTVMTVFARQGR
jgi:exopolysaccharide biosynthesis polyprenyl glycosylphosphotransferase